MRVKECGERGRERERVIKRDSITYVNREPLLDETALEGIIGVEGVGPVLSGKVADDGTRLEETILAIEEDRDLTEGLIVLQVGGSLVLALSQVDGLDLILGAELLEGSNDGTRAGRTNVAEKTIRSSRHGD